MQKTTDAADELARHPAEVLFPPPGSAAHAPPFLAASSGTSPAGLGFWIMFAAVVTALLVALVLLARVSATNSARRGAEDAQAALMGVTRTLRALVTEQQSAIEQMQRAFDDPDVLGGLMDIDLTAGQLARRVVPIGNS